MSNIIPLRPPVQVRGVTDFDASSDAAATGFGLAIDAFMAVAGNEATKDQACADLTEQVMSTFLQDGTTAAAEMIFGIARFLTGDPK